MIKPSVVSGYFVEAQEGVSLASDGDTVLEPLDGGFGEAYGYAPEDGRTTQGGVDRCGLLHEGWYGWGISNYSKNKHTLNLSSVTTQGLLSMENLHT